MVNLDNWLGFLLVIHCSSGKLQDLRAWLLCLIFPFAMGIQKQGPRCVPPPPSVIITSHIKELDTVLQFV